MVKSFLEFFQSPVFEDEEATLRAQLLNVLILFVFVSMPLLLIGNALDANPHPFVFWSSVIGIGLGFGMRWLMRQGRIYLASMAWVILALVIVTMGIVELGTVRATNTFIFLIDIAVAGFLLDRRAVIGVTLYSCVTVFVLGWAQNAGWLPASSEMPGMNISVGFNFLALFIGTAMLMTVSVQMMNRMIRKAQREVIERRKTEQTLRQRDAIMEAATFAARKFLQSPDWRSEIVLILARLGIATNSSHVFIFENHVLDDGTEVTSQRYEWAAPGMKPDLDNPYYKNMPLLTPGALTWYETMLDREAFYGTRDILPPEEAKFYEEQGLLSFINVPIFVGDKWWGVMGFDDYVAYREWTAFEIEAVKIAASTLGVAIQRQLSDEALRQSEMRYRTELEQRVRERTEQLEEALREIEGVSYTASHDLRAPVRAINGYANILLRDFEEGLSEVEQAYLQKIDRESHRMGNLLDDLIRLIRLSRQTMQLTVVNLSELGVLSVSRLQRKFPDHLMEITICDAMFARGDREMLQVVVDELLDNAWKFTAEREAPCVEFGEEQMQDGSQVFFVRDNGIGFDMMYAHKLFHNFEQLHLPGTYEGTGMGLAIVQRIIQRHGGKTWGKGKPGEGATFYFFLPD